MLSWLEFAVLAVACWRLAHLLVNEKAPFGIMTWVRSKTTLGGLLTCIYCASVWTGAGCYLLWFTPLQPVIWVLAISGLALMLRSYSGVNHG